MVTSLRAAPHLLPAPPATAICIINPNARIGDAATAARIRAALEEGGIALIPSECVTPEETSHFIRTRAPGAEAIILGGGDGTISHQLPLLMQLRKPLGVLPLGTANDLARTIGLPLDPIEAAKVIVKGLHRPIDVGLINGRPFLNVASMGLTSMLSRRLSGITKKRFGRFGYWIEGVRAFRERKSFRVWIEAEDGRHWKRRALQVAIGNGRSYGGMLVIDEDAEVWDGLLHLYCVEPRPFLQLLRQTPGFFLGRLKNREGILLLEGRGFTVRTNRPLEISADGEIKARTPATFGLLENALDVYVPAEPTRPQAPALA